MSLIPDNEISNIIETINHIPDCNTLRQYEIIVIKRLLSLLAQTLSSSKLYALLIEAPTDLDQLITWIQNFIQLYILGPYENLLLLEAELLVDYTLILQAFENKLSMLTCLTNPSQLNPLGGSPFGGMAFGG